MNKLLCNTRHVCDVVTDAIVKVLLIVAPLFVTMVLVDRFMVNINTYVDAFAMILFCLSLAGILTATLSYHLTLKQLKELELEIYGTKGKRPLNTKD